MPFPKQPAAPAGHLLEINIISAQDLHPVVAGMKTYAAAWIHPDHKLSTRIDSEGDNNPTWNDKFVFRIDDDFLRSYTSAIMIEIYCLRLFRDTQVGSVRLLLSNLIPSTVLSSSAQIHFPTRFVALQVRRSSGRPQGILNIGVALLDASMRSMPLYSQLTSSAFGYRDLMGEVPHDPHHHNRQPLTLPHLRRTKSEIRSEAGETRPPISTIEFPDFPYDKANASPYSDSEIGPSPSVVAARFAYPPIVVVKDSDIGGSALDGWSVHNDVGKEDLKMKLERWKAELPPIYDHLSVKSSFQSDNIFTPPPLPPPEKHQRRKTDGGGSLFSCFGGSYGCECAIFCGQNPRKRGAENGKIHVVTSDPNMRRTYDLD